MPSMTITEALAEIKVIDKRVRSKQQFVAQYTMRDEAMRDPLEKEGGSIQQIAGEMQAISDLQENVVKIRRAIQKANETTELTLHLGDVYKTRTIGDWLVWRRDVAPGHIAFLTSIRNAINQVRQNLSRGRAPAAVISGGSDQAKPGDVVVNLSESTLAQELELWQAAVESLDGQLSLKNATTIVEW